LHPPISTAIRRAVVLLSSLTVTHQLPRGPEDVLRSFDRLGGAARGVVPCFDVQPIVHEGITPSSITAHQSTRTSHSHRPFATPHRSRWRAMIRSAGDAIGAVAAMVE
jgi:hypothetical protein